MDFLQFSLFFAALLVAYVLVHLRLVRFEDYLRELLTLRTLDERTRQMTESLGKVNLDRIENGLHLLHEDLEDLRETTAQVEGAIVRIPASEPVAAAPVAASNKLSDRVRALVEVRLLQLGYGNLRILSDLENTDFGGVVEVLVECEKGRMPCKGRVLLQGGELRDVQMQTVAQSFP
jgi:hypothetical protein